MKTKRFLRKLGIFTVAILACAFAFTACGNVDKNDNGAGNSEDGGLKTIKIATPGQDGNPTENALLAKQLGYIDEELQAAGYQAEYLGFAQAGPAINEALAAKEVDYAFYNELPALTAKSNGVDIKLIAAATQDYNYAVIANNKSGITSAADLEGKKVIVTAGTILYKYFIDICEANHIDASSIEQINAQADATSVLSSGEADAYVTGYSAALRLQDMGIGTIVADTTNDASERTGIDLVARTAVLESDPDSATALIRALKRAAEYAAEHPDEVYGLMEDENNTADLLKQIYAYDTSFSYFDPYFTEEFRERTEDQYSFAQEHGLLGGEVDLTEFIDTAYLDKVYGE